MCVSLYKVRKCIFETEWVCGCSAGLLWACGWRGNALWNALRPVRVLCVRVDSDLTESSSAWCYVAGQRKTFTYCSWLNSSSSVVQTGIRIPHYNPPLLAFWSWKSERCAVRSSLLNRGQFLSAATLLLLCYGAGKRETKAEAFVWCLPGKKKALSNMAANTLPLQLARQDDWRLMLTERSCRIWGQS